MSYVIRTLLIVALIVSVTGCRNYNWRDSSKSLEEKSFIDRDMNLSSDDYEKALAPRPLPVKNKSTSSTPDLAPIVAEDQRDILPQPLVSVTVNQDVPLRDIFYELAKQAQIDVELDPDITGSVIFTAYNRPFDQVVDRLSEMAGLRYTFEGNVLHVERDLPFMKIYHLDYLGLTRSFTSEIKASTTVDSSAIGASGGGGGQNGSKSTITTTAAANFWKDVEGNISQLLEVGRYQQSQGQKTAVPLTTPNAIPALTTEQLAATGGVAPSAQPMAPVPTGSTEKEEELSSGGLGDPYYSINQQAGLVSIFASDKQHKKVAEYLTALRKSVNTQILIEAKVLEVNLRNEYTMGINWSEALSGDLVLNANLSNQNFLTNQVVTDPTKGNSQFFNLGIQGDDINVLINALSRYGTTRALSSPRVTVMNNQSALLNVSENKVFFNIDITVQPGTVNSAALTTINSEIKSVPEGLIINVHPTVDMDTNEITMNIRPSITKVVGQVADPGVAYVAGDTGIVNNIPIIAVRELDSIVQMKSGETIVMGGLMQNKNDSSQSGVPVLSEIPFAGALFRGQSDLSNKTELVILLKGTVVTPKADAVDKEMMKTFSGDRRPAQVD
jgi:MSHA biogenesis protein MshL